MSQASGSTSPYLTIPIPLCIKPTAFRSESLEVGIEKPADGWCLVMFGDVWWCLVMFGESISFSNPKRQRQALGAGSRKQNGHRGHPSTLRHGCWEPRPPRVSPVPLHDLFLWSGWIIQVAKSNQSSVGSIVNSWLLPHRKIYKNYTIGKPTTLRNISQYLFDWTGSTGWPRLWWLATNSWAKQGQADKNSE